MNKKSILLSVLAIAVLILSTHASVMAFPHASKVLPIQVHGEEHNIRIVIGHTNEPTYALAPGVHDGMHHIELRLSDADTALPLRGSELKFDKYYFSSLSEFENADSVSDATSIESGIELPEAFGDPGHYISRQIHSEGIYGYRIYGTINYFDVASLDIDETIFCRVEGDASSKFNSEGWNGGFGCTSNVEELMFPVQQPSPIGSIVPNEDTGLSVAVIQAIIAGIVIAGIGGFFGIRKLMERREQAQL